jgi:8-oxo-dGTP diphosphatase
MIQYVAGFLFSKTHDYVVLIEKNRPEWQRGLLNGVGGKIEKHDKDCSVVNKIGDLGVCYCSGETPHDAMVREFLEETGVEIPEWKQFTTLTGSGFQVNFFCAFAHVDTLAKCVSRTDERVGYYRLNGLEALKTTPNIKWLIPMALSMEHDTADAFLIQEFAA